MGADFRTGKPQESDEGSQRDLLLAVLGSSTGLGPFVRKAHMAPLEARGRFDVKVPFGALGASLAKRLGLPGRGNQIEVHLRAQPDGKGVVWHRRFGSQRFVTRLWERDGLLVEEADAAEFRYALQIEEEGLRYRQVGFRLRGRGIPRGLSPRVDAFVQDEGAGWRVRVRIRLPVLGTVCAYEGLLEEV